MTRMKSSLALYIILFPFFVAAQYTPTEIRKFRIAKLTKIAGSQPAQRDETWYDENGNDTAEYNNGQLLRRTHYEYAVDGHPISRTRYGADGRETEDRKSVV